MDCNGEVCVRVPPSRQPKKEEEQQEQEQEQEDELPRPSPVLVDDHKDDKPGEPEGMMFTEIIIGGGVESGGGGGAPSAGVLDGSVDGGREEEGRTGRVLFGIFGGEGMWGGRGERGGGGEEGEEGGMGRNTTAGVCMVRHRGGRRCGIRVATPVQAML
ncbi:hypothetical protein Scep_029070 [Stephania cephalantha]|uniref:Uncharacterized protein n=1 Tax=Stephania cephalantha TaxID=152367 RepID=A0AAP0E4J5_9MAGN